MGVEDCGLRVWGRGLGIGEEGPGFGDCELGGRSQGSGMGKQYLGSGMEICSFVKMVVGSVFL